MSHLAKGNLVVSNFSEDTISIIDVVRGKVVKTFSSRQPGPFYSAEPQGPHHMAIDSNQLFLYVANSFRNTLSKIDLIQEKVTEVVPVGSCPIQVVLCKKYNWIYVVNSDSNSISVLDRNSLEMVMQIPTGAMPHGMLLSHTQETLLVANRDGRSLTQVDTLHNQVVREIPLSFHPWHLRISRDGSLLFVANYSYLDGGKGRVEIFQLPQLESLAAPVVGNMPVEVMGDTKNEKLYVTDAELNLIHVYHLKEQRIVKRIPVQAMPHGMEMDAEREMLYVTSLEKNLVEAIDCQRLQVIRAFPTGKEPTSILLL